jgi:putative ABC transport system permease protein
MWSDLRFRFRSLFRRRSVERELSQELEFHLEHQIEKHLNAGKTRDEATRLARLEFGAMDIAKEACRDARGTEIMDSTMKDLTYGLRLLRKAPAFTLLAILSLALGTGVNTAVFSVVYAGLLKPLPYPHADRLVYITRSRSGP